MPVKPRVVVLGGGFAGLEGAFVLRHTLGDRAHITLISDSNHFIFRPNTVYLPFSENAGNYRVGLEAPTRRKDIDFVFGSALDIDPDRHTVRLRDFHVTFDYLLIATGAAVRPREIMGMEKHAVTVWTPDDMLLLRQSFLALREKALAGERQRLLFVIPPANRCATPLYEIALMTDTWLREQGVRGMVQIDWVTAEDSFMQVFGPRLHLMIAAEFEDRGIASHKQMTVCAVEPGSAIFENGEALPFDLLVSIPPAVAASRFESLPSDDRGFVHVDRNSRRVQGRERIFAAGDASDFPIKQAFLALLQAGAAADHIAAGILNRKPDVTFQPMNMYLLEEFDKAAFAQVPLRYTGDPKKPVTVDLEDPANYKVGVSPLWRAGKKALGLYVPWRFASGEPFHAGFAGQALEAGLKTMAKMMAH